MNIKHIINIIQMPLFFSISGFLFYKLIYKINFVDFIKKKFKRLMIPYFVFGLFYVLPIKYLVNYANYTSHSLKYNIFYNIILGQDNGHLWYLLTLFCIFIIFTLYKDYKNKLIDLIILAALIAINIFSLRYTHYFQLVPFYLVFFYFGMLMNKYKLKNKINFLFIFIPIIFLILTNHFTFDTNFKLVIKVLLQLLILFSLYNINFEKLGKNKIVSKISENSFGLYLFHSSLIIFMFVYYPNVHPIITILVNFFVAGFISYIATVLIKKTKLKFIIGQ